MAELDSQVRPELDLPHYRTFISYRHADVDSAVAKSVQRGLERFWVPKSAREKDGSVHIAPVFRDKEELPVSSRLGDDIEAALRGADTLVVICSPRTKESSWVEREIETFLHYHDQDHVFVVLAEGEPHDVIPPRLLYATKTVVDAEGSPHEERTEIEPLACDFRASAKREHRTELTRLAAAILGVSFDSLMRRAQRRRMRLMGAALALVVCVAAYALWSAAQIRENYRQTQINESEALAVEAQDLLAMGDRMEAIQVALAALPKSSASHDRPYVPAAQMALQEATQAYMQEEFWRSCYSVKDARKEVVISDGGLLACVKTDGSIEVMDLDSGAVTTTIDVGACVEMPNDLDADPTITSLAFCKENMLCTIGYQGVLASFDTKDGTLLWQTGLSGDWRVGNLCISKDGARIAVGYLNHHDDERPVVIDVLDAATGKVSQSVNLPFTEALTSDESSDIVRIAFSPDGSALAATCSGTIWRADLAGKAEPVSAEIAQSNAGELAYYDEAIVSISFARMVNDAASFDAFSTDLQPLWHKDEAPASYWNDEMLPLLSNFFLTGIYGEGDVPLVTYVAGSQFKLVSAQTGEEAHVLSCRSPIRACALGSLISILDYEGNLASYSPNSLLRGETHAIGGPSVARGEYAYIKIQDSRPYAVAWDASAHRQRIYRMSTRTADRAGLELRNQLEGMRAEFVLTPSKNIPEADMLLLSSDTELCLIDTKTLDIRWTRPLSETTSSSLKLGVAANALYLYDSDVTEGHTFVEVSWDTGETLSTHTIPYDDLPSWSINMRGDIINDRRVILVIGNHVACIYDPETFEELLRIESADKIIEDCWLTDTACIMGYEESGKGRFELYSLEDGSPMEGELESLSHLNPFHPERNVALNWDKTNLLLVDAEGSLRKIDARTWKTLWIQSISNIQAMTFSFDDRYVMVQDSEGICMLLSAKTGEILRTSSVALPLIRSFTYDTQDAGTLGAISIATGLTTTETYFSLISLDEDAFGPTASLYGAFAYSKNQGAILSCDPLFGDWSVQHLQSLDELIELAHQEIQGHELTDEERHRYRIAE